MFRHREPHRLLRVLPYLMNGDGTLKNWQWFTYDGKKWMVTPYDLDQTFGITLYGFPRPATHSLEDIPTGPFVYFNKYYRQEECERYHELRATVCSQQKISTPLLRIGMTVSAKIGIRWRKQDGRRVPATVKQYAMLDGRFATTGLYTPKWMLSPCRQPTIVAMCAVWTADYGRQRLL